MLTWLMVRMLFWLGIVILLLPSAGSQRSEPGRSLDTLTPADLQVRWLRPPAARAGAAQSPSPASS
jgi:hypothetical protein